MFRKHDTNASGIRKSEFSCKRDGLTLRGTEYQPAGDHLPIAVVCHGFMAFQDTVRQYIVNRHQSALQKIFIPADPFEIEFMRLITVKCGICSGCNSNGIPPFHIAVNKEKAHRMIFTNRNISSDPSSPQ